jgi:hypothetical protein
MSLDDAPPSLLVIPKEDEPEKGQGDLPNGAPTGNPGPCKCGNKHWCDGAEYEFVFGFPTTEKGELHLGFNRGGM